MSHNHRYITCILFTSINEVIVEINELIVEFMLRTSWNISATLTTLELEHCAEISDQNNRTQKGNISDMI